MRRKQDTSRIEMAEHRGIKIFYVVKTNQFEFRDQDGTLHNVASLIAAKQTISKKAKGVHVDEVKQEEQSGLILRREPHSYSGIRYERVVPVKIGAFGNVGGSFRRLAVWVTWAGGRERVELDRDDHVFMNTAENRQKLEKVVAIAKAAKEAEKQAEKEMEDIIHSAKKAKPTVPVEKLPDWKLY